MIDVEKAMRVPSRIFRTPEAVIREQHISDTEKIEILQQWQNEVLQRTVATEEGMSGSDGSEAVLLQRLSDALSTLRGAREARG